MVTGFRLGLHMVDNDEHFGSREKIALARRSASLWRLLRENPRYAYYGRLVALSDPGEDTVEILSAMAKLQGAAISYFYPAQSAKSLFAQLEERGLTTDRHEHFWGGDAAFAASRRAQEDLALPADLRMSAIDASTPRELVREVAELCQSCDVMPVPGSIMRGQAARGICLVAIDRDHRPVATASSYMIHHPSSPRAKDAFWGMLATREDRRGEKIALLLGAQAIIHMWNRHGARGFMTGVRADNLSSQALCNKLGVAASEWIIASCIDKDVFVGSTITK
jgi:Acetyltransferase (GNAT) family